MELRHIRYFLAVVDEGNFTRAACRLGISQPPLSLQIKDLEAEIGAQLFHRVPQGAELTEAGHAFFETVKSMPGQASDAVRNAQRAARGETGQLSLGFIGAACLNPVVPASIKAFRTMFPEVDLRLGDANTVALIDGLREGRLDVAILCPKKTDPHDLLMYRLRDEPLVAALPAGHPALKTRGDLDLAVMKNVPLILPHRSGGSGLYDVAWQACRLAGFEPQAGPSAPQISSVLSLVSAELGFSLVPDCMRQVRFKGVGFRALRAPVPTVALAVAMPKSRPTRSALNFARLARVEAQTVRYGIRPTIMPAAASA